MELREGIITRWSCRAFRPDQVPKDTIRDILVVASRAPSFMNTQPWEIAVVTGQKLAEINKRRLELAQANAAPNPDIPIQQTWPAAYQERARKFNAQRQEAMSVADGGRDTRDSITLQSSQFFGAPCGIFLMMDRTLSTWSIFDMGLFTQTLILAAHDRGLATCIQAGVVRYPEEVRKILDIPDTKKIIVGISLGYPDMEAKFNAFRTTRTDINELTKWYV